MSSKEQQKNYNDRWYALNQAKAQNLSVENNKKVKIWVDNYKSQRGCFDCKIKEPAIILELDHNGPKICEVSLLKSVIAVFNEIQDGKCVVRCSNCHRVKTWFENKGLRYDCNFSYKEVRNKKHPVRNYVNKIKMVRGCLDCQYRQHPAALDFHHLGDKGQAISSIESIELVDVELAMHPCIVLCSNCHRIRHEKEKQ